MVLLAALTVSVSIFADDDDKIKKIPLKPGESFDLMLNGQATKIVCEEAKKARVEIVTIVEKRKKKVVFGVVLDEKLIETHETIDEALKRKKEIEDGLR